MTTVGKTVTLVKGVVVTDVGPGVCDGQVDEVIRRCVTDDGREYAVIARVIRDLPVTYRRADLPRWIY